MTTFLTVLHVIVCIFMIAVILLQRGKGAEIGAVFGGGGAGTVFGSRGAGNFLTKLTTASAVIFMATSLSLSYLATTSSEERLFEDGVVEEAALRALRPACNAFGTTITALHKTATKATVEVISGNNRVLLVSSSSDVSPFVAYW